MKKLRMEDLRVESFLTELPSQSRGTVHAEESGMGCETGGQITACMDTCAATNPCGSCFPDHSCAYTCDNNYGCSTQDYRCTYGGVYAC
jgi:hypothetical protein